MFGHELQAYKKRLLEGGMAWGAVRRHVRELQDHHRDLREQALAAGMTMEAAEAKARQQIGDLEQLATQMLASSQRSLLRRFPVTMNVVGPVFLLILCYVVPVFVLIQFLEFQTGVNPFSTAPQWLQNFMPPFMWVNMYAMPFVVILPLVFYACRTHVPSGYWVTGVVLLCALGAGLDMNTTWPDPVTGREGSVGASFYGSTRHLDRSMVRFVFNMLLASGFAWFLSRRQEPALE